MSATKAFCLSLLCAAILFGAVALLVPERMSFDVYEPIAVIFVCLFFILWVVVPPNPRIPRF